MLKFKVIPKCYQDASQYADADADFLLENDNWNDFSYCTTYHLHTTKKTDPNAGARYLGVVHIMHKGQEIYKNGLKISEFNKLDEEYCSICWELDLYSAINRLLNADQRKEFAAALRLVTGIDTPWYDEFSQEECFQKSFLRYADIDSFVLQKGRQLLFNEARLYNLRKKSFKVSVSNCTQPIELRFPALNNDVQIDKAPDGMIAFIGHNGSGKSTLLYTIAKVLYASPTTRKLLESQITIAPKDLGVMQLMMFSYSAFDNFVLPWLSIEEYKIHAQERNLEEERFIFCGLRDTRKEAKIAIERINEWHKENPEKNANKEFRSYLSKRTNNIVLKHPELLGREVADAFKGIISDGTKNDLLKQIIEGCRKHNVALYSELAFLTDVWVAVENDEIMKSFIKMSTGHKFFTHAMTHLIAYLQDDSIVLFDEPENHLQPCLLSYMMQCIRQVAALRNSVVLVATHSPVVLQEMMSDNIFVIRRDGDTINVSHPEIQTFGANFGMINSHVFDLTGDVTLFRNVIEELFNAWCKTDMDPTCATEIIEERAGTTLSPQMAAYVMSLCCDYKEE